MLIFPPSGSVFCLVSPNRYLVNLKFTKHQHLSLRASDWPIFQLSGSNDPLAVRISGHPSNDSRSPKTLKTLDPLRLGWAVTILAPRGVVPQQQ